jgi:type IV pilus assembly protein PilW
MAGRHAVLATRTRRASRGAGLVEVLVGALIGLVVTVVMLDVFAGAEGVKRNAASLAAAQETGALLVFALGVEIANAGHGLAAAPELATCPDTGAIASTLRPIPVLITAGATPGAPDTFVVNYGAGAALATPMPFAAAAPPGAAYRVRAPIGFAAGDAIVAVGPAGHCAATTAVAVSEPDADGVVEVVPANPADAFPAASVLLDLGPQGRAQRVRYDVADGTLRSLDLATPGAAPNPLASDIVNVKLQYGVDTDDDGFLDRWVSAAAAPWDPASVLAAPAAELARIKAVRLGVIVRSAAFDRSVTAPFAWVLFDCAQESSGPCAGRLVGTLPPNWRYRIYETVIPLRNAIWNAKP